MFEQRDVTGVKRVLERGGGTSDIPELLVISIIEFLFLLADEDFAEDATAAQVLNKIIMSNDLSLFSKTDVLHFRSRGKSCYRSPSMCLWPSL